MADDNLKEILGFDPDHENPPRSAEVAPSGLQSAFLDFRRRIRDLSGIDRKEKVIPEKLLIIGYNGAQTREYFSLAHPRAEFDFTPNAEVRFYKNNAIELEWFGEGGNSSGILGLGSEDLACFLIENERSIDTAYGADGSLSGLTFGILDQKMEDIDGTISVKLSSGEIQLLYKKGKLRIKRGRGNSYDLSTQGQSVILKRFHSGKLKDHLIILGNINQEEIIQRLFNPLTLKDPINAPPELDNSWHYVNPSEIMGIEWQRY